ncbi:conserved hypothetical protein [Catenulispora acidiphila DSM 44928]|uniref:Uncharacterized protein n=1 Tax=Catenulispora acidiphila (strain DSM 44928 / JCM 14897 / NBRC 102108 / NRRL B-24433 / ID139908) TaxID=479433 RepID=C7QGV1_CATAD|nr:hypothetical protein [Catenulispora acidiphila]ACU76801.1 conserved hypothetical protein [Catenulispora acidiphila DSM 44928]
MSDAHRDLSPLDDFPFHQTSESMAHVATSDRNFYDRYYFNVHHCADDLFMALGVGQYPNLGVTDAFAAVVHNGVHRVVRASRELGSDRGDTSVGPFGIEVLEPLNRLRVVLEPGEYELSFDLTWTGSIPATREPRQFVRRNGRVWMDSVRLAQTGYWEGTLRIGEDELTVTPATWWGSRDRSWGIRPVGEAEPAGIGGKDGVPPTFHWIYAPMQFDDFSILVIAQEDEDGGRVLEEAVKVFRDGRPAEALGRPELELHYTPGTRDVETAAVHFTGRAERVRVTQLIPLHMAVGSGYGLDADWRHGMYQGPDLVVQQVVMPAAEAAAKSGMFGITERLARFEYDGPEGVRTGFGLFETLFIGAHRPSGFADWLAVAP